MVVDQLLDGWKSVLLRDEVLLGFVLLDVIVSHLTFVTAWCVQAVWGVCVYAYVLMYLHSV